MEVAGWRFLEKMVQLPLTLPESDGSHLETYVASLLNPQPAAPPSPPSIDQGRVRQYEGALRAQMETVSDVSTAYGTLQEAARTNPSGGSVPDAQELATAAVNVFSQVYRDDDPDVQKAIREWAQEGLTGNPRELKRFINLFRFYLFIQLRREVGGLSETASLSQVAKISALALRWPHLLGGLVLDVDGGGNRLAMLESQVRSTEGDDAWSNIVDACNFEPWEELKDASELEGFLRKGPPIAKLVEGFL